MNGTSDYPFDSCITMFQTVVMCDVCSALFTIDVVLSGIRNWFATTSEGVTLLSE